MVVVRVSVVEQVGEQLVREKAAVAPVGSPEAEKETACVVPETRAALVEVETEAPWPTDLLPPLDTEKLKAAGALTVTAKLVVRVTPPPVPFTVIV